MNFFNKLSNNYSIKLNPNQVKAVKHFNNPALTLAIPGSGKTTLLLCRILYLNTVKEIPFSNILTLTFSKASAEDMQQKFNKLFPDINVNIEFSTIHKFAYTIVRKYYRLRNINFTLIEGKQSYKKLNLLRSIYKLINNKIIPNEDLETLINDISFSSNMMLKSDFPTNIKNFEEIYKKYKEEKKKNKYIDFDDMLLIALRVLEKHSELLNVYYEKYKYLQVDEAQDTSVVQHKLIKLLSLENNNIMMVADDDQSIYGFRGAFPKYLLNFEDHYSNPKIYYLNKNYRSSYEIIETCSGFISKNKDRYKKNIKNNSQKNNNIDIIEFSDDHNRNKYLINYLSHNVKETAILYRNNISALPLINLLEKENIEFNVKGGKDNFFNNFIVKDMKAFFNLLLINQDLESFERIYYKLNHYISRTMVEYLKLNIRGGSVFDCLIQNPNIKKFQADTFRKLKGIFLSLKDKKPIEIINMIKYELNYLNYLNEFSSKSNNSYNSLKDKLHTLELIATHENSAFEFLNRLDYLDTFISNHSNELDSNLILSTMHSSKGLEFENVFIIDIYDNILPQKDETLEEDRRLLYVGLSRAKDNLSILHSKFISGKFNGDIKFINELKKNNFVKYKKYKSKTSLGFECGELVNHKKFGLGKIIDINNRNISIKFNDSLKVLSKEICIKEKLLSK